MTRSARRAHRLVGVATLVVATVLAAVPGSAAGGRTTADPGAVPAFQAMRADDDTKVKEIAVKWAGDGDRDYVESARVPGIGNIKLVCKPGNTIIKLTPDSRAPETQMWLAKYEMKDGNRVVAVKNARVYTYANANDDGKGGTGRSTHEGLNQRNPIENRSQDGYAFGLISQRPGRHQPAGNAPLAPVTSFYLTWFWNGFDEPRGYQSCEIRLRMVTHLDERVGLNWHGNQDAAGNTVKTATIPGYGQLRLTCEPGRDNAQTISLDPDLDAGGVYAETITGEGRVDEHVESESYDYDSETGLIGPLELPRNGMVRVQYTVSDGAGGWTWRWFYVSSYTVVNNTNHPELNVCEVAVGGAADQ